MSNRKKYRIYRSILGLMLATWGLLSVFVWKEVVLMQMPEKIMLYQGQTQDIRFPIPVQATILSESREPEARLKTPVVQTMSMTAQGGASYRMKLSALGLIPMQSVSVEVVSPKTVILSGETIGIYLKTEGVLVLDTGSFEASGSRSVSPAKEILQSGDYILKINGEEVASKKDVTRLIHDSDGKEMIFTIQRNDEVSQVAVTPEQDARGEYKAGVWVRDSAQGIGTVTYLTEEGRFGALGHGISDADTATLMHLGRGSIYATQIVAINKGEEGMPGQLTGMISYEEGDYLGKIDENSAVGIYGTIENAAQNEDFLAKKEIVCPIALKQEVRRGTAQIYCDIGGTPDFYDIFIERYSYNGGEDRRQIMFSVSDERLLNMTGGIIQGMSGSPIVQNGKIIGAVTHVLVNDPGKGYGIFIEEMLEH